MEIVDIHQKNRSLLVNAEEVDEESNSRHEVNQTVEEIDKESVQKWLKESETKHGKDSKTYRWLSEKLNNDENPSLA